MVPGLLRIAFLLSLIYSSLQFNGKIYSNTKIKYNTVFDAIENFEGDIDDILICVVGVSKDDILIRKEYGLRYVNEMDDNCDTLQNLLIDFSKNKNLPFHIVDGVDEITKHGIYLLSNIPLESEIAELLAPGQIVNIALTTCPFAVTQLPLNVSHPVHKDLLNPTKFERSLDNKIDVEKKEPQKKEIYILPVQVEQITVILSIFFVVAASSLFMMSISTPNSVKQSMKLSIN
ncbi:hypothetical protein BMR1_03g03325 [Babesia microti strain RI]|uniref:Uncharacterized protein n=1 Tax=Babesia microti (strain RI) TaxID=1133968 RepID=A0A0K3AS21_BABMR|nr:hypothetical protein BMR1_03g03325 [Babesia microti strain RI]CTQ41265.1 hypothetical protein BMR1_03g03325 [Babesia microti strain RI]|eukprot:XP_012649276.1 hypothetical protein BMR1_03g03325 [Babesia microti strain RI]